MRLLRFGPKGAEKPGLLDAAGRIRDLSGHVRDITPDVLAPDSLKRLARLGGVVGVVEADADEVRHGRDRRTEAWIA